MNRACYLTLLVLLLCMVWPVKVLEEYKRLVLILLGGFLFWLFLILLRFEVNHIINY